MAIHTVIMAGGAGTRLLPLTAACPKPLASLCGAPIMDYILRLLEKHGLTQADVTLWYRPQDVEKHFGSGAHGVRLRYVVEDRPVGTAGSVLLAAGDTQDTVLVLSGDGLTDVDLSAAQAFHRQHGGAATLVLKRVRIPLDYGVVVTDGQARVTRFIEKPDWSRVISSQVNTGVYLLEPQALALIPRDRPFDFGRELFPLMLEKGLPIYGYETQDYWCDVGNPAAFLQAQADLLAGKTKFDGVDHGRRDLPGVSLSADSYVARDAQIAQGAVINRSCVLSGAYVGPGTQLDGAIVCAYARAEQGAALHAGTVLGSGSTAGAFSTLRGQARVWPGIRLPDDAVIEGAVRQDPQPIVLNGRSPSPQPDQWMLLVAAFLKQGQRSRLLVAHDGKADARYHTVLGTLAAYGAAEVTPIGRASLGMLSYAVAARQLDGGLMCRQNEICLLDRHGLLLGDRESALLTGAIRRRELPAPHESGKAIQGEKGIRGAYIRALARSAKGGKAVQLVCADPWLQALAQDILNLAGCRLQEQASIRAELREDELRLTAEGQTLSQSQLWELCALTLKAKGETVYDTADIGWYAVCDASAACLRQRRTAQDPIASLLLALTSLSEQPDALTLLQSASHRQVDIPCDTGEKGRVLEALLADASPRPQGGLAARHGDARAIIRPDPALPLVHVAVSAHSAEYAQELCDLYAGKVLRALRSKDQ